MTDRAVHRARRCAGLLALVVLIGAGRPGTALAQTRWLQNVQLLTPVTEESVSRALLDSLFYAIQEDPILLKRAPEDTDTLAFSRLEDALLGEGLDFTSATHLFISYRLEANQRRFQSEITSLFFIYRPQEIDAIDVPIMYIDAQQEPVQRLLTHSGTPLPQNEAVFVPFADQLTFHKVPESTLVSVGGRVIRDENEAAAEKARLLSTIRRFVFN